MVHYLIKNYCLVMICSSLFCLFLGDLIYYKDTISLKYPNSLDDFKTQMQQTKQIIQPQKKVLEEKGVNFIKTPSGQWIVGTNNGSLILSYYRNDWHPSVIVRIFNEVAQAVAESSKLSEFIKGNNGITESLNYLTNQETLKKAFQSLDLQLKSCRRKEGQYKKFVQKIIKQYFNQSIDQKESIQADLIKAIQSFQKISKRQGLQGESCAQVIYIVSTFVWKSYGLVSTSIYGNILLQQAIDNIERQSKEELKVKFGTYQFKRPTIKTFYETFLENKRKLLAK